MKISTKMNKLIIFLTLIISSVKSGDIDINGIGHTTASLIDDWNQIMKDFNFDVHVDIIHFGYNHERLYNMVDKHKENNNDVYFVIDIQSRRVAYTTGSFKCIKCRKLLVRDLMEKKSEGTVLQRFHKLLRNTHKLKDSCNNISITNKRENSAVEINYIRYIVCAVFLCILITFLSFSRENKNIERNTTRRKIIVKSAISSHDSSSSDSWMDSSSDSWSD